MVNRKSDKELAFLHDLFVATDWEERFAQLIDERLEFPEKGCVLYVGAGTGGHAMALHERLGSKVTLTCIDENEESLELARVKASAVVEPAEFRRGKFDALEFSDNQFDCVVGNASLLSPCRVKGMLSELVRLATANGKVALTLPTASSFGEFFSIYWEALHNCGLVECESDVEGLITELPTISDVEHAAEEAGLERVTSWSQIEEFEYESGEVFLKSPLIADFLMRGWLKPVREDDQARVMDEIVRIINEESHQGEFTLTVKATLVVGTKAQSH